jgi:hypothetical protein
MSPINRAKIPIRIEDAILFESDHTCCICRMKGKDVQIHHIDGNNSNRKPDNLAVVCLDCHSRVTGKRGLGKSYRPGEIRRYKRSWEMHVEDSRKIHRPQIKYKKELISHIDIIICEILAMKKNNSRVEELINVLYEIHLWRGDRVIDSKILEGLGHLAVMSGLDPSKIAPLVSDLTWDMSCHYVGPDYVAVKEKDVNYILKCVNVLETLSTFNCEFGHGRKATNSIAENLEKFFEIALWYATKKIANKIIHIYKESLENCYDDKRLEFPFGRASLRKSVRRLKVLLGEEQKSWTIQLDKLDQLLKI